eukprot:3939892-Rhodomonas_salina.1
MVPAAAESRCLFRERSNRSSLLPPYPLSVLASAYRLPRTIHSVSTGQKHSECVARYAVPVPDTAYRMRRTIWIGLGG